MHLFLFAYDGLLRCSNWSNFIDSVLSFLKNFSLHFFSWRLIFGFLKNHIFHWISCKSWWASIFSWGILDSSFGILCSSNNMISGEFFRSWGLLLLSWCSNWNNYWLSNSNWCWGLLFNNYGRVLFGLNLHLLNWWLRLGSDFLLLFLKSFLFEVELNLWGWHFWFLNLRFSDQFWSLFFLNIWCAITDKFGKHTWIGTSGLNFEISFFLLLLCLSNLFSF